MPHRCGHLFPLEVRQGGVHERSFVTTNRLVQNFPFKDVIYTITIEPDFEYDLASVPKWLHSFIGPNELCWVASAVHDALYRCKGDLSNQVGHVDPATVFNRREADDIFLELMIIGEVPTRKRVAAHVAVSLFGRKAWDD